MRKYLKGFLFISGVLNSIFAIGIITKAFDFPIINAVNSIITVISVIGIYKYRKWGVYLYLLSTLIALIYSIYSKANLGDCTIILISLIFIYPIKYIWKEFK